MAGQRKVFRIEGTGALSPREPIAEVQAPPRHTELMNEIAALRAMLTSAAMQQPDKVERTKDAGAERLVSELSLIVATIDGSAVKGTTLPANAPPITRIANELAEVANSTEQATQRILAAAEEIDQVTKNLSAALSGKFEQGLVQDIQDHIVRIFEACNFQDLSGQRISKVLSILNFVEDHVGRVLEDIARDSAAARRDGSQYLHGPRLEADLGHVCQTEIDEIFGKP